MKAWQDEETKVKYKKRQTLKTHLRELAAACSSFLSVMIKQSDQKSNLGRERLC